MLRATGCDDEIVDALLTNWETAPLGDLDRRILRHVDKLTREPGAMREADLEPLREAGLDDTGILQVNLIASFFNYINRVADGLGVGRA